MGIRLVLIAESPLQRAGIRIPRQDSKLFLQVHSNRTTGSGLMLPTREILFQQREHLIYHESAAALGQAAQRGCKISVLGISRIHVDKALE